MYICRESERHYVLSQKCSKCSPFRTRRTCIFNVWFSRRVSTALMYNYSRRIGCFVLFLKWNLCTQCLDWLGLGLLTIILRKYQLIVLFLCLISASTLFFWHNFKMFIAMYWLNVDIGSCIALPYGVLLHLKLTPFFNRPSIPWQQLLLFPTWHLREFCCGCRPCNDYCLAFWTCWFCKRRVCLEREFWPTIRRPFRISPACWILGREFPHYFQ